MVRASTAKAKAAADRERLAADLLRNAREIILKRYGPGADEEQYAGEAVIDTLNSFDAKRGVPIVVWLRFNIRWTIRRCLRAERGRIGSVRRHAEASAVPIENWDMAVDPGRDNERAASAREKWLEVITGIERLDPGTRIVGLGKALAGLDTGDIARMLCVGRRTVNPNLDLFRRSL